MPEEIIVESWREKTASSEALTPSRKRSLISREACLSAMSRTISPRDAQLVGDGLLGVGLDFSPGLDPGEVHGLEDVGAHLAAPYAAASDPAPSRRRSSSGVDERASASFWVILPARTSVASEASIVCMPDAELVCRTE